MLEAEGLGFHRGNNWGREFEPEAVVKIAKQYVMAHGRNAKSIDVQIIRALLTMLGRLERRDNPEYKNITWDKD